MLAFVFACQYFDLYHKYHLKPFHYSIGFKFKNTIVIYFFAYKQIKISVFGNKITMGSDFTEILHYFCCWGYLE